MSGRLPGRKVDEHQAGPFPRLVPADDVGRLPDAAVYHVVEDHYAVRKHGTGTFRVPMLRVDLVHPLPFDPEVD